MLYTQPSFVSREETDAVSDSPSAHTNHLSASLFKPILHIVLLIWKNSAHYNTPARYDGWIVLGVLLRLRSSTDTLDRSVTSSCGCALGLDLSFRVPRHDDTTGWWC